MKLEASRLAEKLVTTYQKQVAKSLEARPSLRISEAQLQKQWTWPNLLVRGGFLWEVQRDLPPPSGLLRLPMF